MPHSSQKDVNKPMDAWDRQRCGLALLEIRDALFEIAPRETGKMSSPAHIAAALSRVSDAVNKFVDETE